MSTFNELISQVGKNPKVRTFGTKADYTPDTTHKDVVYFATDEGKIYLNGKLYGGEDLKYYQVNNPEELRTFMLDRAYENKDLGLLVKTAGFNNLPEYFRSSCPEVYLIPFGRSYSNFIYQKYDTGEYNAFKKGIYFMDVVQSDVGNNISFELTLNRSNDFTDTHKATLDKLIQADQAGKVMSDNNYSNADKSVVDSAKDFLQATDPGNTTINKWKELEAFLTGITDTQTLTKLLQDVQTAAAADAAAKVKAVQDAFDEYKTQMNTIIEDIYRIIQVPIEVN